MKSKKELEAEKKAALAQEVAKKERLNQEAMIKALTKKEKVKAAIHHRKVVKKHAEHEQLNRAADEQYKGLLAKQQQHELDVLKEAAKPIEISIESSDIVSAFIENAYTKKYEKEPWYKKPAKDKEGHTHVHFPSEDKSRDFALEMAGLRKPFLMCTLIDGKKHVVGYSLGGGKLFHPDKQVFNPTDLYRPSTRTLEDFIKEEAVLLKELKLLATLVAHMKPMDDPAPSSPTPFTTPFHMKPKGY